MAADGVTPVLQKQLQPGRLSLEGYLRCIVYYQGEEGAGLCQTVIKGSYRAADLVQDRIALFYDSTDSQDVYKRQVVS